MTDNKEDAVKIISITPDTSQPLKVGDKISVEVEVEYKISSIPAQIALNIQDGKLTNELIGSISEIKDTIEKSDKFASFIIARKIEILSRKEGKMKLAESFKVPDTNSVQIFTPIYQQGQEATEIVDNRFYAVESNDEQPY